MTKVGIVYNFGAIPSVQKAAVPVLWAQSKGSLYIGARVTRLHGIGFAPNLACVYVGPPSTRPPSLGSSDARAKKLACRAPYKPPRKGPDRALAGVLGLTADNTPTNFQANRLTRLAVRGQSLGPVSLHTF